MQVEIDFAERWVSLYNYMLKNIGCNSIRNALTPQVIDVLLNE